MSLNLKNIVGNIFDTNKIQKNAELQKISNLQQLTNNMFGKETNNFSLNPFLTTSGKLVNSLLDYQGMLDNPNIPQVTKDYITEATGLSSTATQTSTPTPSAGVSTKVSTTTKQTGKAPSTGTTQTSGTTQKATATGNSIADAAQKYLGTPYVWGGESMAEGGMDCSGFVYNALKDAGYDVGRTTAQGYRNQGTSVSKENLQPGDLVFYGSGGNASHIGIYLGNGQVIHSSGGSKNTASNPGKGVSITTLDSRSDYLGAKRYN